MKTKTKTKKSPTVEQVNRTLMRSLAGVHRQADLLPELEDTESRILFHDSGIAIENLFTEVVSLVTINRP